MQTHAHHHKDSSDSTHKIWLIVALFIAALLGFAGYSAYRQSNSSYDYGTAATSTPDTTAAPSNTVPGTTAAPATNTMESIPGPSTAGTAAPATTATPDTTAEPGSPTAGSSMSGGSSPGAIQTTPAETGASTIE